MVDVNKDGSSFQNPPCSSPVSDAGHVDTSGFLAFQGLFTAHVTGNFVTLGASLALGTSGALAKLLALPAFCAVVIGARLFGILLANRLALVFEIFIGIKILLLIIGACLAIRFGPFHDGDSWQAILTGMVLVAVMAIQNAVHRVHLGSAPPSTLMTGTTTQIMLDLADRIYARKGQEKPAELAAPKDVCKRHRLRHWLRRCRLGVCAFWRAVFCVATGRCCPIASCSLSCGHNRYCT